MPLAALRGACRDHPLPWQRAGKGLELLCSPPSSRASEEGRGLLLPAWHCWHLPSPGTVLSGMESTGISQKGPRSVSLSRPQLGPSGPGAASIRALTCRELPASGTTLLTSLSPSSSSSSSFLPCNTRAGAATAAFVKHFKAQAARVQAGAALHRQLLPLPALHGVGSGSARCRPGCAGAPAVPPAVLVSVIPATFCITRTFNETYCFLKKNKVNDVFVANHFSQ